MSSSARVYAAIQTMHAMAGLMTHDLDHARAAAEYLPVEERDAIEQGLLRFSEECVRLRAVERELAGTHYETFRVDGALASRDCECSVGHDHREEDHGVD